MNTGEHFRPPLKQTNIFAGPTVRCPYLAKKGEGIHRSKLQHILRHSRNCGSFAGQRINCVTITNEPPVRMTKNNEQTQHNTTQNNTPQNSNPPSSKKKKFKNKAQNQSSEGKKSAPHVDADTRAQLTKRLLKIASSNSEEYTFEEGLSSAERKFIHEKCRKMGLISKSSGKGTQRCISVRKDYQRKATVVAKEKKKVTHLTFSEEGKDVLRDLFSSYPPNGEEGGVDSVKHQKKSRSHMRSEYDMFSRSSLSKADIEKRKQLLYTASQKNKNMKQIIEKKSQLPIAPFRDIITSTVDSHQVVLISGETGCGKTTQVPQFILDSMWDKGEACKIVCSQPRRISATSVAERIASERGQNIGEDVGYKIRLESKGGNKTSIVFCTNGVLLKILVSKGSSSSTSEAKNKMRNDALSQLTHIIVDEIHERDRYSDFMLALIRDELPCYPNLRLIIMSATLDAEMFSKYFGGCPVIRVPGFTHPVKTFYLEDVISILASSHSSQLSSTSASMLIDAPALSEEDKVVLDEAITIAWSNDEFDPLIDLIQSEGTIEVFNYQHSASGMTPLMVFAGKGRVDEVRMLLSLGADCSSRDIHGENSIELAIKLNQTEAVEIIDNHMKNIGSNLNEEKKILDKYLQSVNPHLIDFSLIEKLIRKICNGSEDGAILVFLPGWDDIKKIREMLLASSYFKDESKFLILSLHSMVPPKDQKLVFVRPPAGCRKIILSTNIAETSVTIDDVVYVIDSGKMKEKSYDPYTNASTLQSSWISKASVKQREGRAGRCQPGICYHLFTRERETTLPSFQTPEIKRIPIEELCLQVKMMDPECNIETILQKTIDPPVHETIRNGITVLQDIGALSQDERLTELGAKLGLLPVHPLVSKTLFLAILLKCLDPALTFACASDYKDPFVFPIDGKDKAAAAKAKLASIYDGNSDQLAVIAAFECWKRAKENHKESVFYSDYFISRPTMYMLSGMRKQLLSELRRHGFLPDDISNYNVNAHDPGIIHSVLVAGLYPMVGRLIMGKSGRPCLVEIPNGSKVRLHCRSAGSGISITKSGSRPLIIYDEITRTDYGVSIRDCTVIGPLPLLLLAKKIAVAPITDSSNAYNGEGDGSLGDPSGDVMSSPTREVMVIIDRWLSFGLTAIDFAQIYCLRERVSKAVTYTVTHPGSELPVVLAASMHALACLLSYDGMSNMGLASRHSKSSPNYIYNDNFLLSLLTPAQVQNMHNINSPPAFDNGGSIVPHFVLAEPLASPGHVNPASVMNPSPSISAAIQLHPSMESRTLSESIRNPPVKSKRKKKKSDALSSREPNDPAPTRKPTLAGYGATTYGPYGPRAGVNIQRGNVGVKRRHGAL